MIVPITSQSTSKHIMLGEEHFVGEGVYSVSHGWRRCSSKPVEGSSSSSSPERVVVMEGADRVGVATSSEVSGDIAANENHSRRVDVYLETLFGLHYSVVDAIEEIRDGVASFVR